MSNLATMAALQDKVKERIQTTFLDLIPEDQWNTLVNSAIESFIETKLVPLVHAEMTAWITKHLKEELAKPEWQTPWILGLLGCGTGQNVVPGDPHAPGGEFNPHGNLTQGSMPGKMVELIIEQLAPQMVNQLMRGVVMNAVGQLRSIIR